MRLLKLDLSRVLDDDDPFSVWNDAGERIQERRLATAGSAGDQDVQLRLDERSQ
jgi:hypothetical protein